MNRCRSLKQFKADTNVYALIIANESEEFVLELVPVYV